MSTRLVSKLEETLRGRNALLNLFELWVGLAAMISLIVFFYQPASIEDNSVAKIIGGTLAITWEVCYGIAGGLIWYGLLRPSPRWEIAGLSLLGAATAINGFSIINFFGYRGVATAAVLVSLALAAWVRAMFVYSAAMRLGRASLS